MGREIKRVALDFNWPLNKVWEGYINPHYKSCPECEDGHSKAYNIVAEHVNNLVWDERVCRNEAAKSIVGALTGRQPHPILGWCGAAAYCAVEKLGETAGLPDGWMCCSHCGGEGVDPAVKELCEKWEPWEPPEGAGYQLWETTSEGSPVSPVFATPESLAKWLEANKISSFGHMTCSYSQWLDFIRGPGWAPSATLTQEGLKSGVAAAVEMTGDIDHPTP